jgi:hypothetical protein
MEKDRICDDARIQEIARRLKQLRVEGGYKSYENFAFDNELPRMQYWRMEKGVNFTMLSLMKVLDIHGIKLEDFFKDM